MGKVPLELWDGMAVSFSGYDCKRGGFSSWLPFKTHEKELPSDSEGRPLQPKNVATSDDCLSLAIGQGDF